LKFLFVVFCKKDDMFEYKHCGHATDINTNGFKHMFRYHPG
jgi:hypothetical protein